MREAYEDEFEAGMGAEAIKKLLAGDGSGCALQGDQGRARPLPPVRSVPRMLKRLEVVEAFRISRQPARSG